MSENNKLSIFPKSDNTENFVRQRLNTLLAQAIKKPLVIVCAGMGYGKTYAVFDFIRECGLPPIWIQLSENDNITSRFWENYTYAVSRLFEKSIRDLSDLGFPDTKDKLNIYLNMRSDAFSKRKYILILDDVHLLTNTDVIRFLENIIHDFRNNVSIILICRKFSHINISGLQIKDMVSIIQEEDLNFTQSEFEQYLSKQGLTVGTSTLREILHDTNGWAFSVNFIARSLKKSPGYSGYARNAFKQNIFKMMEAEVWDEISEELKQLMVRLSLIEHLSADLVANLAGYDDSLLVELEQQSAYIRFDNYNNAYLIHHLFLDFLRTKQAILNNNDRINSYKTAASWCKQNVFLVDALIYYEKAEDYKSIVSVFVEYLIYVPSDFVNILAGIIDRAPRDTFERVKHFATMHVSIVLSSGNWSKVQELVEYYEQKFLDLPENSTFRIHNLQSLYYLCGFFRTIMSTIEDCYDFDVYYAKLADCLINDPIEQGTIIEIQLGPWINMVGSARKGAPQEFIEATTRSVKYISNWTEKRRLNVAHGFMMGKDILCEGELLFYQGNIPAAEPFINRALEYAKNYNQFEIEHRALFYIMRIAVSQRNLVKAQKALADMASRLDEKEYLNRFINYDISNGWYQYILGQSELIPDWLKGNFSQYRHPKNVENFGNQLKARYHYLTKTYSPLLAFIEDLKRRESVLFGRIEMLSIEACVYYKMKDIDKAFSILKEAYETASPNNIVMPFVELGKDMRALTSAALRDPDCGIPKLWLRTINKKSALYAKHQALIISEYTRSDGKRITLSPRENEVLRDLYNGLTRSEIATKQGLSINTIKMIINNIFEKLNAYNVADVIRIASELKLL